MAFLLFLTVWEDKINFDFGHWSKTIDRWNLLKYPLSKQNMQKNVFGGHFPTEHKGVTDENQFPFADSNNQLVDT